MTSKPEVENSIVRRSYKEPPRRNEGGLCRKGTMPRDKPGGLIEPMFSNPRANPLALRIARKRPPDDRPPCLEKISPLPRGEFTLTEKGASPFHGEPRHALKSNETPLGNRSLKSAQELEGVPQSMMLRRVGGSEKVFNAIKDCTPCLGNSNETFRWVGLRQSDVI